MNRYCLAILCCTLLFMFGCSISKPVPKPDTTRCAAGVVLDGIPVGGLTMEELSILLRGLGDKWYIAPKAASFSDTTGEIIQEAVGRRLNHSATLEKLMSAPRNSNVTAVFDSLTPEMTVSRLAASRKIGGYSSPILDDQTGRMNNISLTAKMINNVLIKPGQEFSFNRYTGEPTEQRGFAKATIYDNGKHVQGIGGGMCQVSSTLYNTVLAAHLEVTERHPHSQPVYYVPPGRDATTYSDKDLRFVNNTRNSIMIRAFIKEKSLRVDLWAVPGA